MLKIFPLYKYKHWAIVESVDKDRNVWCYHITDNDARPACSSVSFSWSASATTAALKYQKLNEILGDSLYRVNNQEEFAKEFLGIVGKPMPDIDKVMKMLDEFDDKPFKYGLATMNCEHFATFCRYGIGWSTQINWFAKMIGPNTENSLAKVLIASKLIYNLSSPWVNLIPGVFFLGQINSWYINIILPEKSQWDMISGMRKTLYTKIV